MTPVGGHCRVIITTLTLVITSGMWHVKCNHLIGFCLRVHKAVFLCSNESGAQSWLPRTLASSPVSQSIQTWMESHGARVGGYRYHVTGCRHCACVTLTVLAHEVLTCVLRLPIWKLGVYICFTAVRRLSASEKASVPCM